MRRYIVIGAALVDEAGNVVKNYASVKITAPLVKEMEPYIPLFVSGDLINSTYRFFGALEEYLRDSDNQDKVSLPLNNNKDCISYQSPIEHQGSLLQLQYIDQSKK
ncbi:MAG: hypothetical protein PHT78_09855 [Desulfitobacteriaceae bacterium]|nr:hypothetical protein [Desulfitobacteriaceae bacterium]